MKNINHNVDDYKLIKSLHLLTSKPQLYVYNVSEKDIIHGNNYTTQVINNFSKNNSKVILISSLIGSEIAMLNNSDKEFLGDLGLNETGLTRLIKYGYELLNLITFFTVGPKKETRAWTVNRGSTASQKLLVRYISDLKKGFGRAETFGYNEFYNLMENKALKMLED